MDTLQTLTILKTDIAGFTARVDGLSPADLDRLLDAHRRLLTPIIARHGGAVVKEIGDSLLATFRSSTAAVRAAIAIQRELTEHNASLPAPDAVEVRIAVTAGDVLLQNGDVFGTPVNAAARIEEITPPGQVYFSEAVCRNLAPGEIAAELVDTVTLKGLPDPQRIYRTAFRHHTRILRDAVVTISDLAGFTRFAETGRLADVEDALEFWDAAHRRAAAAHHGVIRATLGDSNCLTFDSVTAAVAAWKALATDFLAHKRAIPPDRFPITFGLGLATGGVRIFRSAVYGRACNTAAQYQGHGRLAGPNALFMEHCLLPQLPPDLLDGVRLVPLPLPTPLDLNPQPTPDLPSPSGVALLLAP